jgi:hypothetical protein
MPSPRMTSAALRGMRQANGWGRAMGAVSAPAMTPAYLVSRFACTSSSYSPSAGPHLNTRGVFFFSVSLYLCLSIVYS